MAAKILILFVCILKILFVFCNILCEEGFCTRFRSENTCSAVARECSINNATHYGLRLPSPTICNCCDYCLPLFNEGSVCSVGGPGDGVTVGRCGHGLNCSSTTTTCVRITSKCHEAQDLYDMRHNAGHTGTVERRPLCDTRGNYETYDCVPSQTCFCQSEEGERLFGEVPFTGWSQDMPCGCSRMIHNIEKYISSRLKYPVIGLRCTADGNFNPVQCIDRTCFCVNRITGEMTGNSTINLDERWISKLPCYDEELDLFPIRNGTQSPFNYTTPCYDTIQERRELIEQSIAEGFNVDYFTTFDSTTCMPDGTFSRMTINSNGSKICIDARGIQIGDYEALPDTTEYDNMDCKCAKTANVMGASTELPICCKNGNFRPVQCRRGHCRCVDSDGRQIGTESTNVTALSCYDENWKTC